MNTVTASTEAPPGSPEEPPAGLSGTRFATTTDCLIHVRFAPNGTVTEIGERPGRATAQQWYNYLSSHTRNVYRALSGGRGLFRLPREEVENLKTACALEVGT